MLTICETEVYGWEAAIRGMRNPKNSWEKSDSAWDDVYDENGNSVGVEFCIGENDNRLAVQLAQGGPVHAKYRRFIAVTVDINAPLYWWKEFKTYRKGRKFLDDEDLPFDGDMDDMCMDAEKIEQNIEMNSCSTMHRIHSREFTLDDFSVDQLDDEHRRFMGLTLAMLNESRKNFLAAKDKKYWWEMIQMLPSSYMQKRTVLLNYEVLHEMYKWRRHHKLDEWHVFCDWVEGLPYSHLITGKGIE